MTYMLLLVSFLLVIWVVDVLYFSQKDVKKHRGLKRLKDGYKANRNF